tara:strand:+ start:56 stop:637 length:582 start_codon:yes stop_codon:yes gene_type:complete
MISQARGMTLVEVMVATTLFSMIMLATVTALRTFALTYDRVQQEAERTSQIREGDRFIRQALQDAVNSGGLFEGSSSMLHWVAPVDRAGAAAGLQHIRLLMRDEQLLVSFAPLRASLEAPDWGQVAPDFPLLKDLENLAFSYQAEPLGKWLSRFEPSGESTNNLPWAVKLELVLAGKAWPPIVVCLEQFRLSK